MMGNMTFAYSSEIANFSALHVSAQAASMNSNGYGNAAAPSHRYRSAPENAEGAQKMAEPTREEIQARSEADEAWKGQWVDITVALGVSRKPAARSNWSSFLDEEFPLEAADFLRERPTFLSDRDAFAEENAGG